MHSRKKRTGKSLIILIILAELSFAAASLCVIFYTSFSHITQRRQVEIVASLDSFDEDSVTDEVPGIVKVSREQVSEERDETVWTTDNVNYRQGPDETYESAGSLSIYTGVKRTGITYNEWSQIEIGDQSYYISSDYLTTEEPIIKVGGAKGEYQKYALSLMPEFGWEDSEMYSLIKLWDRESGWNPNSHNGGSGAHGIPQALPASKMASEGSDYYTNGNTQIRWGLKYIAGRYGSPSNAWSHFCSNGWY